MYRAHLLRSVLPLALTLSLVGCDRMTGFGGSDNLQIVLRQGSDAGPAFAESPLEERESGSDTRLSLADVSSIDVTVTGVRLRQRHDDEHEGEGEEWVRVPVTATTVNLLALPTTTETGIRLASGSVPAGTYRGVRLVLSGATITLNRDVTVGSGTGSRTFKAGTAHPLLIGKGGTASTATPLEVVVPKLGFTVGAGSTEPLALVFDVGSSIRKVAVTNEGLRMSPVIKARKERRDK